MMKKKIPRKVKKKKAQSNEKYCPDCLRVLQYIGLSSTIDYPNEFRTSMYICKYCTLIKGVTKLIYFRKTVFKELKLRRKFPSATRYMNKLTRQFEKYNNILPITNFKTKQNCVHCKKELYPDSQSSNARMKNKLKIKSFFHDCTIRNGTEMITMMCSGVIEGIEFTTIVEG